VRRTLSPSVIQASGHYAGGPAVRPEKYPVGILWNVDDAKSDPDVVFDPQNPCRIPMASALRHEDGRLINSSLYNAIRSSVRSLIDNLLFPVVPKDQTSQRQPRTKRLFKDLYCETWNTAVNQYETEQPLLALCSGHWKAEHLLGSILTSIEGKGKRHEKEKKKLKGKGKSRAQCSSSPLADDVDTETRMPSMPPDSNFQVAVDTLSEGKSHDSLVGGKRPWAGSLTLAGRSGPQPIKKPKTNGVSHGDEANIGISYRNLRCCLHGLT
jgi:hypothetical protein